jgi:hypothetical protein
MSGELEIKSFRWSAAFSFLCFAAEKPPPSQQGKIVQRSSFNTRRRPGFTPIPNFLLTKSALTCG